MHHQHAQRTAAGQLCKKAETRSKQHKKGKPRTADGFVQLCQVGVLHLDLWCFLCAFSLSVFIVSLVALTRTVSVHGRIPISFAVRTTTAGQAARAYTAPAEQRRHL